MILCRAISDSDLGLLENISKIYLNNEADNEAENEGLCGRGTLVCIPTYLLMLFDVSPIPWISLLLLTIMFISITCLLIPTIKNDSKKA